MIIRESFDIVAFDKIECFGMRLQTVKNNMNILSPMLKCDKIEYCIRFNLMWLLQNVFFLYFASILIISNERSAI